MAQLRMNNTQYPATTNVTHEDVLHLLLCLAPQRFLGQTNQCFVTIAFVCPINALFLYPKNVDVPFFHYSTIVASPLFSTCSTTERSSSNPRSKINGSLDCSEKKIQTKTSVWWSLAICHIL